MTRRLGILGGTFDPVHFGHLDAAAAAQSALALHDVLFVPSHDPPHRPDAPHATGVQRLALVTLAINGVNARRVSDVELRRNGPSYTADTLRALHAEGWAPMQLFFILGADAFAEIATWRELPFVLDATNFAVIARPGTTIETAVTRTPELQRRTQPASAASHPSDSTGIFLVEAATRDISSTLIRQRLAAGQPIDDLVPATVARHIAAHRLYNTEDVLHGHEDNKTEDD
ncbi:MAG: nicotinate-nucleotide adenylyltransferase [Acidobacteria bacterium]|nr:nicotinate-nucleotide adenylyltransferase [Acidobacteriota bacterium]